jgi:hypothetical protein
MDFLRLDAYRVVERILPVHLCINLCYLCILGPICKVVLTGTNRYQIDVLKFIALTQRLNDQAKCGIVLIRDFFALATINELVFFAVGERELDQWKDLGRRHTGIDSLKERNFLQVDGYFLIIGHLVFSGRYLAHRLLQRLNLAICTVKPNGVFGVNGECRDEQLPN